MDATRSEVEFTAEVLQIALDEGATTINIPDTVGYATPDEYAAFLTRLYELVPDLRDVVLSVHCHDDLGLAVANSIAGVQAGARQIECAVNGIGERAGNASLEELIMLLHTRRDRLGYTTGAVTTEIARTSRLVSRLTGYAVQPNKAIVGRNAFAHESGIHQDGVLKARETYEIMDARSVGLDANSLVLGKHSGRAALRQALEDLGYTVDGSQLKQAFERFKEVADRKKQVTAMDLEALVTDELRADVQGYSLRVVRRRGIQPPPAARDGRGAHARRRRRRGLVHRRRSGRRDLPRDQQRDEASTPGCASSASTRSPAARTRSARSSSSSSSARPGRGQDRHAGRADRPARDRRGAGGGDRHHRGGGDRLRARARQRGAARPQAVASRRGARADAVDDADAPTSCRRRRDRARRRPSSSGSRASRATSGRCWSASASWPRRWGSRRALRRARPRALRADPDHPGEEAPRDELVGLRRPRPAARRPAARALRARRRRRRGQRAVDAAATRSRARSPAAASTGAAAPT